MIPPLVSQRNNRNLSLTPMSNGRLNDPSPPAGAPTHMQEKV
jgi:hypothetical protein